MKTICSDIRSVKSGTSLTIFSRSSLSASSHKRIEDFKLVALVGSGAFGRVYLAKDQTTDGMFALKVVDRHRLTDMHLEHLVEREEQIMLQNSHPFIVELEYVFSTEAKVYFLMPYVAGGDLFKHLKSMKRFDERVARFYAA